MSFGPAHQVGGASCVACHPTEASQIPVLVNYPPPTTHAHAHAHTHRGRLRDSPARTRTTPPPHGGLGHAFRCWVLPASKLSSLQALSTQLWAARAGSPSGRPFPHTPSHACTHPPARGHTPAEGPAPGLALLASIIPVDSEPLRRLPHLVCHSFQGPDWRRDCGHPLRGAAGCGAAAWGRGLPVQVLLLLFPSHHPGSLCLGRSPRV